MVSEVILGFVVAHILVQHIKTLLPGLKTRISTALVSVAKEHASYGEITESKVCAVSRKCLHYCSWVCICICILMWNSICMIWTNTFILGSDFSLTNPFP